MSEDSKESTFTTNQRWLLFLFFVLGLALRFWQLDIRPVHHDESLHLMYGRYFFDWPDIQFYKYDAMLHGPLLYNALRGVYDTLGSSAWAGRTFTAVLGSLVMFSPLLFRRKISSSAIVALSALFALSPHMVYWSRFIREDMLQLILMAATVIGVVVVRSPWKSVLVAVSIALQFCEKENSYVTLALLIGFLGFEFIINQFQTKNWSTFSGEIRDYWKQSWKPTLSGLAAALVSFALIASNRPLLNKYVVDDMMQLAVIILTVLGIFIVRSPFKSVLAFISFISLYGDSQLLFPSVTRVFAFLLAVMLVEFVTNALVMKDKETSLGRLFDFLSKNLLYNLIGVALGFLIYCYFYSAGFRYSPGIIDGFYRKSLSYWFNQHSVERISGPFLFHAYSLTWYDTVFVALLIIQIGLLFKEMNNWLRYTTLAIFGVAAIITYQQWGKPVTELQPWKFFKLKGPGEIFGLFVLLVQPVVVTLHHLLRRERVLAFWGYWFWASFFTYSYLGEKVPWLSLYILVPGIIYVVLYFASQTKWLDQTDAQSVPVSSMLVYAGLMTFLLGAVFVLEEYFSTNAPPMTWASNNSLCLMSGFIILLAGYLISWQKLGGTVNLAKVGMVIAVLYSLRMALMTSILYAGDVREYISQVHTTKEFHDFVLDVRRKAEVATTGKKPQILAEGDAVWPITWYLVDVPEYKFSATPSERKNFDYIFQDYKQGEAVPEGFCALKLKLRGWWVPDFAKLSVRNFLVYMFNHRPWSDTGWSYVTALVKSSDTSGCGRTVP